MHLNETAQYQAPSGVDNYGQTSWGAKVEVACLHVEKLMELRTESGTRLNTKNVLLTHVSIPEGSRVWTPGADFNDDTASLEVSRTGSMTSPVTATFVQVTYL